MIFLKLVLRQVQWNDLPYLAFQQVLIIQKHVSPIHQDKVHSNQFWSSKKHVSPKYQDKEKTNMYFYQREVGRLQVVTDAWGVEEGYQWRTVWRGVVLCIVMYNVQCCEEKAVWSASREKDGCSARDGQWWRSPAGNTTQLLRVNFSDLMQTKLCSLCLVGLLSFCTFLGI